VLLQNCNTKAPLSQPWQLSPRIISSQPEVPSVRIGIIPSLEIAPLLVAQRQNIFAKYGLTDVQLVTLTSWQSICDRLELGTELGTNAEGLDGGHLCSPLPELLNEGVITKYTRKTAMYTLMRLHTNGGYISVSKRMKPFAVQLKRAAFAPFQDLARFLGSPIKSAIAASGDNYDLWLRYWLSAMTIIPDRDIEIMTISPEQVVAQVRQNQADLLCLNSWQTWQLTAANLTEPAIAIADIWQNHPGELLAMRSDWVDKFPIATQALLQAIMEAQIWCDDPKNWSELNRILTFGLTESANLAHQPVKIFAQLFRNHFFDSPNLHPRNQLPNLPSVMPRITTKYWSSDGVSVSYPYKSHDLWFLTEYRRWQKLPDRFEVKETIDAVNREDLWRQAARAIGVPDTIIPTATSRGIETFFDGVTFDPSAPEKYLALQRLALT
jgi:ABC-type nitrate/sulfonate/bicarbonate transport system substrate-binding protein